MGCVSSEKADIEELGLMIAGFKRSPSSDDEENSVAHIDRT
jgi:hypothetical protein